MVSTVVPIIFATKLRGDYGIGGVDGSPASSSHVNHNNPKGHKHISLRFMRSGRGRCKDASSQYRCIFSPIDLISLRLDDTVGIELPCPSTIILPVYAWLSLPGLSVPMSLPLICLGLLSDAASPISLSHQSPSPAASVVCVFDCPKVREAEKSCRSTSSDFARQC